MPSSSRKPDDAVPATLAAATPFAAGSQSIQPAVAPTSTGESTVARFAPAEGALPLAIPTVIASVEVQPQSSFAAATEQGGLEERMAKDDRNGGDKEGSPARIKDGKEGVEKRDGPVTIEVGWDDFAVCGGCCGWRWVRLLIWGTRTCICQRRLWPDWPRAYCRRTRSCKQMRRQQSARVRRCLSII